MLSNMDLFALTRKLVDIESITGNERAVGEFLHAELTRRKWDARLVEVEAERFNLVAVPLGAKPELYFSTHMDTVPPFIPSSEDEARIWGRGSCDAKGIIAAQIIAAEKLREQGVPAGLLFLVGEERDSLGAKVANQQPNRCKFLINGEPTENKLALGSKGESQPPKSLSIVSSFAGCGKGLLSSFAPLTGSVIPLTSGRKPFCS